MIVNSDDIPEWIASHAADLVRAWTPEIVATTGLDAIFAEALATEFQEGMLKTLRANCSYAEFEGYIRRSNTGLPSAVEIEIADRFYSVTLKLARAAHSTLAACRSAIAAPFIRATVLTDGRHLEGTQYLDGIILPLDHPFWRTWLPPLSPDDIRARWIGMTRSQLEQSGKTITDPDELAWREERLTVRWPAAFEPLLDFRNIRPVEEPPRPPLTDEQRKQLRAILDMFDGKTESDA